MKIWSLPKHEHLTTSEKYCGKEEKLLLRSNFSSFPQYFHYTSNFKSPITYKFVKCGCSNYFFLDSANLIYRGMDILKYFRESLGIQDNEYQQYLFAYRVKNNIHIIHLLSAARFFIIHLFKQKENPQVCDNHRGIFLLSIA